VATVTTLHAGLDSPSSLHRGTRDAELSIFALGDREGCSSAFKMAAEDSDMSEYY
jgi:hypothetical protein